MPSKILVADDDFDNRAIASEILASQGYEVIVALNGREAVQKALKESPSLIFLDLSMPQMDGWQAASEIKKNPATSGIPIVAFTAHAMVGDEKKALEAGCDDYLSKPCTPQSVIEKVNKWMK
ncbi:MAG: response regulator [Endomicrobiales bacterium]|nr:response regulator [Endomicrobiales bacterium]